jgi:Mn2+/Fe2+ NRAMP family transporter
MLYTGTIAIGAIVVLIPDIKLIPLMLSAQVKNGVLLPFVLIFMLLLVNNKRLMGKYVNSKIYNILAVTTAVVMICLSIVLLVTYF